MKRVMTLLLGVLICSCASQPKEIIPITIVDVHQKGDTLRTCNDLNERLTQVEAGLTRILKSSRKRGVLKFVMAAASDMALTVVSLGSGGGASSLGGWGALSNEEKSAIQAYTKRHQHLMLIAEDKKCDFVEIKKEQMASKKKHRIKDARKRRVDMTEDK